MKHIATQPTSRLAAERHIIRHPTRTEHQPAGRRAASAAWDQHALAVEHYATTSSASATTSSAAAPTARAARHAFGPPPADPADRARYRRLAGLQTTLDL